MTMPVTRTAAGIVLGEPPDRPEFSALLEADGATLIWDLTTQNALPAAIVWDPRRAAAWAWQVYGPGATDALAGTESSFAATPGPALAAARTAARCGWARAWWPASRLAELPPLDPRLLDLEEATALVELEHLLDDPEGVDDRLGAALAATAGMDDATGDVGALIARGRELAADRGLRVAEPAAAPAGRRSDFALAAGDATGAPGAVATGTAPLDLSRLAPGTVDAAEPARWSIHREAGETVLEVTVERAPRHPADTAEPAPLEAGFAGVTLSLIPEEGRFAGRVAVPARILLSRPEQRVLEVASPGYGGGWQADADALLALARASLARARQGEPDGVTLAEAQAAVQP
ncbi:MAG: hypothetical protein QM804_02775 [Propionicimonas sp.]